ncbi:transcription termination factor 3, mitochondrial [Arapaima gigas]
MPLVRAIDKGRMERLVVRATVQCLFADLDVFRIVTVFARCFVMALSGMRLCRKCSFLLGVRKLHTELQQSSRVLCLATGWQSTILSHSASTGPPSSSVLGSLHRHVGVQEGKMGVCAFSDICASSQESQTSPSHPIGDQDNRALDALKQSPNPAGSPVNLRSLFERHMSLEDLDGAPALSPFEEISDEEAIQIQAQPTLPPVSISLRDYVNQSETLQQLVLLGVNLWKLEQRPNVGSMLLRLDFQKDVKNRLLFLKDLGVEDSQLGPLITRNPFILTESLENLKARAEYLKSKKFSPQSIASMVSKAPYLLNFSIERLDNRLSFYQQTLGLSAEKTRNLIIRLPRLLCGSLEPVKENLKVCELEFGFHTNEIQQIVTTIPKVLTANKKKMTEIFDYVHNVMGIPHSLIAKSPQVLNSKMLRVKERHLFLQYLGRAQYDPTQPNYVSLDRLVSLPDSVFCSDVALASLKDFELFQKTL